MPSPGTNRQITRQIFRTACITLGVAIGLMLCSFLAFVLQDWIGRSNIASSLFVRLSFFAGFLSLVFYVTWAVRVVMRVMRDARDRADRARHIARHGVAPGEDGRRYTDSATVTDIASVRKLDPAADPVWLRQNGMPQAADLLEYMAEPREIRVPAAATVVTCPICRSTSRTDEALPAEHIADPTPGDDALLCPNSPRRWRIIREGNK